jgi:hypothetical protein
MFYPDPGARLDRFVKDNFQNDASCSINKLNGFSFDTEVLYQGIRFRVMASLFKPTFTLSSNGWAKEVGPQDMTDNDWATLRKELQEKFPGIKLPVRNPSPKPTRKK